MSGAGGATTVGRLRREIARRLAASGRTETPDIDARILVAHALGLDPMAIVLADDRPADPQAAEAVGALAARRIAGEPVGRIIGKREFWGLTFRLAAETLEPRPDTETVVSAALGFLDRERRRDSALSILDLGTGSGAILLALLSELPAAEGVGVDRSAGAAAAARDNAHRLGLVGRAHFLAGNWADAIAGRFDFVVANPPYIRSAEIPGLPVEVRAHDPHIALDGGPDGLRAYAAILSDLGRLLKPDGRAFLEIGRDQGPDIAGLARAAGFADAFHDDLAGIVRVIELSRPSGAG